MVSADFVTCVLGGGTTNKKLSYRKQIARKLRTQYVEGICTVFRKKHPILLYCITLRKRNQFE